MTRTLRGETPDGASYFLVEEVAITKATERNGAYVPEAELRASVERWVDVPVTLNHPRSEDGTLLSIRYDDELRAEHELGRVVFQGAVAAEPVEPGVLVGVFVDELLSSTPQGFVWNDLLAG